MENRDRSENVNKNIIAVATIKDPQGGEPPDIGHINEKS